MNIRALLILPVLLMAIALPVVAQTAVSTAPAATAQGGQWKQSPIGSPDFFPLCVWCQSPAKAEQYKALGINTYVGLWQGPTEEELAVLKKAGLKAICTQNDVGLKHLDDPTIIGWMHGDEPDNAQDKPKGQEGYDPPILPAKIVADYEKIRAADPSRPVLLNLGQGVAWDGWYGRGVRSRHPEDYPEYVKGGDIVSFDIYPVNGDGNRAGEINNKLWLVPFGVDRLRKWGEDRKIVWNCIECTSIGGRGKPTPAQVRSEVWMSLIHGSRGLIYFCHVWKPKFIEAGPLADPEMSSAIAKINKQITELAPVLNSPTLKDVVTVESSNKDVPVDVCVKENMSTHYIFAVAMRDGPTKAMFTVNNPPHAATVEVLGEDRLIYIRGGQFSDDFKGYEVHLYKIVAAQK